LTEAALADPATINAPATAIASVLVRFDMRFPNGFCAGS
jgi:hypothetical protein